MLWAGALLAAGASRRFGADDKLLATYRGRPLVAHAAQTLLSFGAARTFAVVSSEAVAKALPEGLEPIFIAPGQGLSVSFRAAIDAAGPHGADRLMICLGDMPEVAAETLARLGAAGGSACALAPGGARTPPIRLDAADFAAARLSAEADRGARRFLNGLPDSALIPIDAREARDVDIRDDLA